MEKQPDRAEKYRRSVPSPTLEDVATRAGVSTATVSRCLNNPSKVAKTTRERVLEAVRTLGYAPNFGAQALAAKRTNTFGAIIPTMENAIFARGLQAFQEELQRNGITLLVASSSYTPELEEQQIRGLVARGADALLLIGHARAPQVYEFLDDRQVPYVITWTYEDFQSRISIGFDNRKAMKCLAERVISLGHRNIALITSQRKDNDRASHRCEGIQDAMALHGIDPEGLRIVETPYTISNGADAFASLMESDPRPTAVLCGNDVLAAGALLQARKMNLDVPGDVSITGFDDIEIAQIVTPALTTVHVPHREMGKGAARLLLGMRNGQMPTSSTELEAHVVLRDSLGPAPRM
ncbi:MULTISPECIES: LacI family DNA-binding transcriptional regulator [unclassified Sulfitobacter]|nr:MULTISPECIES: LacI family DNA-binding transcriptional regulator [unclassified Sulfitobacter]KZX96730.1 LacI family transcriptional regulator [Sulfitobacter sp. HI0023]KZY24245.1 LacI family transcriptional regulator [Sulfitobacter sp. HI0040]KZZ67051.1 LacI family transcriptional regulator [Sulfitobacter sp. HI0129]